MSLESIRAALLAMLGRLAPEADLTRLDPQRDLREQLDIDSFALLTWSMDIEKELGVTVPEADYAKLRTLDDAVRYLASRGAAPRGG